MLSEKQFRFVVAYCETGHVTKSAISAGYAESGADVQGSRLLDNVNVQQAIEDHRRDLADAALVTNAAIIREFWKIAFDRPPCCRHCYGLEHAYQWTEKEYGRALTFYLNKGGEIPDSSGGLGYQRKREPNPDCPECKGLGIAREGEKTADRLKALDALARIKQMMIDKRELSGPGGGPLQLQAMIPAKQMTDDELMQLASAGPYPELPEPDGGTNGGTPALA